MSSTSLSAAMAAGVMIGWSWMMQDRTKPRMIAFRFIASLPHESGARLDTAMASRRFRGK
jgi:hypothetical protein